MSAHDNIPTEEILKDIHDTELEIITMKREAEAFRMLGDRMSLFRADARMHGIDERKAFIEKLRHILAERNYPSGEIG